MTKEERNERRKARTREFARLMKPVAAHFDLDDANIDAAFRAAFSHGYVSQHALECYRAIVRSL